MLYTFFPSPIPVSIRSGPRTKQPRTASTSSFTTAGNVSSPHSLSLSSLPNVTLATGMNVFVNGEFGVVRYIGNTAFAEGVWLGVELRKQSKQLSIGVIFMNKCVRIVFCFCIPLVMLSTILYRV